MAAPVRAFLAIQPPADVRISLRETLAEAHLDGAKLRSVEEANIHLTIEFLGNIPEESIKPVAELLDDVAADTGPFDLEIVGISAFPSKRPVVIAAELVDSDSLFDLVAKIRVRLGRIGFQAENRPFRPHITVARIRGGRNRVRGFSLATVHTFAADQLILFKSDLTRAGAQYTQLHSAKLEG